MKFIWQDTTVAVINGWPFNCPAWTKFWFCWQF